MTTTTQAPSPSAYQPIDGRLLDVENLHVHFHTADGVAKAINGVSFHLDQGESLAILGESGSGKSVTAQAIMGILDMPPARIPEGVIPVFPVGWQIAEMFREHRGMNKSDALAQAVRLMERVQIPAAKQRVKAYPHQFSGGMRQRIMIAMAIALDPAILIADEPTTALDVTVQAQIMSLLQELQAERHMGLILITHDLGVVADVADRIAVMYAGRLIETSDVYSGYANPAHPYTKGLLDSLPRLDQKGQDLASIPGLPPNLLKMPTGCAFNPRCPLARDLCREQRPELVEVRPGRFSACHFTEEVLHA